ncbi:MAG: flavin reductase family protein [Christensenellales bacterium]|jgi:flavin reductase (DIM6/NTAB) family NADH-FMN oxidoreductase RutF
MSHTSINPSTLLSPAPVVLVGCATQAEKANLITVAWVGTVNSKPPMVSVSIQPIRHSYHLIKESGEFTVNLVSRELLEATDFCGVKSGRDMDKFAECNLTAIKAEGLAIAPAVKESPLYLSCKVREALDLGSHTMFVGEIVHVGVRSELIDQDGKIHLNKANLVAYAHGNYYGLAERLGFFGYSVARPEVFKRRMEEGC